MQYNNNIIKSRKVNIKVTLMGEKEAHKKAITEKVFWGFS
jgi:hypothetical protein